MAAGPSCFALWMLLSSDRPSSEPRPPELVAEVRERNWFGSIWIDGMRTW